MHIGQSDLKKLVLNTGLVDEREYNEAVTESKRGSLSVAEALINRGSIPEDYFTEVLGSFFGVPIIDLKKKGIKQDILEMIPETMAKDKRVAIFEWDEKKKVAKVAMADPGDFETQEFIKAKFNCDLEIYIVSKSSLNFIFRQYKNKFGEEFVKIIEENVKKSTVEGEVNLEKMARDVPIINILDTIIEYAINLGSSDIHFEPLDEGFLIRFRVEGMMREIFTLPSSLNPFIVARVKILANLLIDEHRIPQDGRFNFGTGKEAFDVRVSIIPTLRGEKAEMRILHISKPLNLKELGFSRNDLRIVEDNIKKSHGMILTTGPTGSGKTTTLYTVLHILNTPSVNIMTIEDPVEYDIPHVSQTAVNAKFGITFASGLRSLVRQDPDIIMIGEIRDNETATIAVHSALIGHLILSTLHTNDAVGTFPRMIDIGISPVLLASTINLIIAQRLVRKICGNCVESYPIPEEMKDLIIEQAKISGIESPHIPERLFRGKGCPACNNSGYSDRLAIFECLNMSKKIRDMVAKRVDLDEVKKEAVKEGMTPLLEDGLLKIESGLTTIEEVLRAVRE